MKFMVQVIDCDDGVVLEAKSISWSCCILLIDRFVTEGFEVHVFNEGDMDQ